MPAHKRKPNYNGATLSSYSENIMRRKILRINLYFPRKQVYIHVDLESTSIPKIYLIRSLIMNVLITLLPVHFNRFIDISTYNMRVFLNEKSARYERKIRSL